MWQAGSSSIGWIPSRGRTSALILLGAVVAASDVSSAATMLMYHRGGETLGPENTIAGIELAFDIGGEAVEIDVGDTSDGISVLMHDETVDRTTDGTGPLADLTLVEVMQLDAGSYFAPEFAGEPVPTLTEALVALQALGGTALIDRKLSDRANIADAVALAGFPADELFAFEQQRTMIGTWTQLMPGIQVIFTERLEAQDFDQALFDELIARGASGVSLRTDSTFTQEFVDRLHSEGFIAFRMEGRQAYEPSLANHVHALEIGVDVLDTSSPDVYEEALRIVPEPSPALARGCAVASLVLLGLARKKTAALARDRRLSRSAASTGHSAPLPPAG
jgi:glycerophosphoryl diester phosphodiesterase